MTAPPCRVTPYTTTTVHGKNLSKKIGDGSLADKPISSAAKPLKRMCSNEDKPSIVEASMNNPSSLIFEQLRAKGTSTANVRSDVIKCAGAGLRTSVLMAGIPVLFLQDSHNRGPEDVDGPESEK
jgi:hypothetical protein